MALRQWHPKKHLISWQHDDNLFLLFCWIESVSTKRDLDIVLAPLTHVSLSVQNNYRSKSPFEIRNQNFQKRFLLCMSYQRYLLWSKFLCMIQNWNINIGKEIWNVLRDWVNIVMYRTVGIWTQLKYSKFNVFTRQKWSVVSRTSRRDAVEHVKWSVRRFIHMWDGSSVFAVWNWGDEGITLPELISVQPCVALPTCTEALKSTVGILNASHLQYAIGTTKLPNWMQCWPLLSGEFMRNQRSAWCFWMLVKQALALRFFKLISRY